MASGALGETPPHGRVESLDDVEIIEKIGEGSYGSVYKACHVGTGELVALKAIEYNQADENGLAAITREINMLRQCQHPNIVGYRGSFLNSDLLYIAMEYCSGGSCSEALHILKKPFTEPQIAHVCREALKGLEHLRSLKRLHRDIKGGNVLLTSRGEVRLADFGVSAQLQNTLSRANTFIGTPYWMAPEIIQGNPYNDRADVWSLAITAIELCDLYPPYADVHPMKVLFFIPNRPHPKPRHPEQWSEELLSFLDYLLVKDPQKRPSSAEALNHPFLQKADKGAVAALVQEVITKRPVLAMDLEDEDDLEINEDTKLFDESTVVSGYGTGTIISRASTVSWNYARGEEASAPASPFGNSDYDNSTSRDDDEDEEGIGYDSGTCVVHEGSPEASNGVVDHKIVSLFDTIPFNQEQAHASQPITSDDSQSALDGGSNRNEASEPSVNRMRYIGMEGEGPRLPKAKPSKEEVIADAVDFSTIVRFGTLGERKRPPGPNSPLMVSRKTSTDPGALTDQSPLNVSQNPELKPNDEKPFDANHAVNSPASRKASSTNSPASRKASFSLTQDPKALGLGTSHASAIASANLSSSNENAGSATHQWTGTVSKSTSIRLQRHGRLLDALKAGDPSMLGTDDELPMSPLARGKFKKRGLVILADDKA